MIFKGKKIPYVIPGMLRGSSKNTFCFCILKTFLLQLQKGTEFFATKSEFLTDISLQSDHTGDTSAANCKLKIKIKLKIWACGKNSVPLFADCEIPKTDRKIAVKNYQN